MFQCPTKPRAQNFHGIKMPSNLFWRILQISFARSLSAVSSIVVSRSRLRTNRMESFWTIDAQRRRQWKTRPLASSSLPSSAAARFQSRAQLRSAALTHTHARSTALNHSFLCANRIRFDNNVLVSHARSTALSRAHSLSRTHLHSCALIRAHSLSLLRLQD